MAERIAAVSDPLLTTSDEATVTGGAFADQGVEVIRSEESLQVGVSVRERGRVRIAKRVVTEERTVTVTVRREELVVTDLPVDASSPASSGTDSSIEVIGPDGRLVDRSDDVLDLVLHEERVVTDTVVVPVERVRVRLRTVRTATDVGADLAREVVVAETTNPALVHGAIDEAAKGGTGRADDLRTDVR